MSQLEEGSIREVGYDHVPSSSTCLMLDSRCLIMVRMMKTMNTEHRQSLLNPRVCHTYQPTEMAWDRPRIRRKLSLVYTLTLDTSRAAPTSRRVNGDPYLLLLLLLLHYYIPSSNLLFAVIR